jgi:hypothetical protein
MNHAAIAAETRVLVITETFYSFIVHFLCYLDHPVGLGPDYCLE